MIGKESSKRIKFYLIDATCIRDRDANGTRDYILYLYAGKSYSNS